MQIRFIVAYILIGLMIIWAGAMFAYYMKSKKKHRRY